MNILFLRAIADNGLSQVVIQESGNHDLILNGCANIQQALAPMLQKVPELTPDQLLLSPLDLRKTRNMSRPNLVVNEISEPDSHQKMLDNANQLMAQLSCPVINAPANIVHTRRERLAEKLKPLSNIRVPKTLRCQPSCPDQVAQLW